MTKKLYPFSFSQLSNLQEDDYPRIPARIEPLNLKRRVERNYQKQMDNFNEMTSKAFHNYPHQTIVGKDTLTWLPQEDLNQICGELFGKSDDYVACTNHSVPTDDELASISFIPAGSNTYVLDSLPKPIWPSVFKHESDHHAITSAKHAMAYEATQQKDNVYFPIVLENIFLQKKESLDSINNAMDETDWFKWFTPNPPEVQHYDYEPSIKKIILDYIKEQEKFNEK